jgi:hypothetical protein
VGNEDIGVIKNTLTGIFLFCLIGIGRLGLSTPMEADSDSSLADYLLSPDFPLSWHSGASPGSFLHQ